MIADIAVGPMRAEYYAVLRIGGNLSWAITVKRTSEMTQ